MRIGEVIGTVDKLLPNRIENQIKITWLKLLDMQVEDEVIDTHVHPAGYQKPDFDSYDMDTELLINEMYSDVYLSYLKMKIAKEQVEAERYAIEVSAYNNAYITYQDSYNRKHMPITRSKPVYR